MDDKSNVQKGKDLVNIQPTININASPEEDMGIISEIIENAIEKHKEIITSDLLSKKAELDLELLEKIDFNFQNEKDKKYVTQLFEDFFEEIHIMDSLIESQESFNQYILFKGVKAEYNKFYNANKNLLLSLEQLFNYYCPLGKEKDPKYANYSKAFVLFFFDDCTIGETKK